MAQDLLRCIACKTYCIRDICPICGGKALNPKPPKYSVEDKYAKYRRMAKAVEE